MIEHLLPGFGFLEETTVDWLGIEGAPSEVTELWQHEILNL
jgi:hypothetical protein